MPGPISYSTSSSFSSLPSKSRTQVSQIAKAYRQAAQLFLTRRLPEAYSTIEPVITPRNLSSLAQQSSEEHNIDITNSFKGFTTDGLDTEAKLDSPEYSRAPAPVASASRGTRVKVWSFYLTFLNAVVELGPEEGKLAFGSTRWKALVSKAKDGSVWEDIVRDGYRGDEGAIDGEVIVNLATLLLTHSPSQKLNQQRLETYLAISPLFFFPFGELGDDNSDDHNSDITVKPVPSRSSSSEDASNTNVTINQMSNNAIPSRHNLDLALKVLELYALHILPRNDEWDYAREFIQMNSVLDEERKQAFLIALHVLKEEERLAAIRGEEQRQAKGRRKGTKSEEDKKRERKRKQSSVTVASGSTSSDEVITTLQTGGRADTADAIHTPTAGSASSRVDLGSNSKSQIQPGISNQERQHYHQEGTNYNDLTNTHSIVTPANNTITSDRTNVPSNAVSNSPSTSKNKSKARQFTHGQQPHQQRPQNKSQTMKQHSPRPHQPYEDKSIPSKTNMNKNDNNNNNNNNNILTKLLSPFYPLNSNTSSPVTTILSVLKSVLPIHNHHPALIKSILYILAVLMGVGIVGSAAGAASSSSASSTTRTLRTAGPASTSRSREGARMTHILLPVRLQHVLHMLRNLMVLIWMSVKRTVGMGVAVSYV